MQISAQFSPFSTENFRDWIILVRCHRQIHHLLWQERGSSISGHFFSLFFLSWLKINIFYEYNDWPNDSKNNQKAFIVCAFLKSFILPMPLFFGSSFISFHFVLCLCIVCKIKLGNTNGTRKKNRHWSSEWRIIKSYAFNCMY